MLQGDTTYEVMPVVLDNFDRSRLLKKVLSIVLAVVIPNGDTRAEGLPIRHSHSLGRGA